MLAVVATVIVAVVVLVFMPQQRELKRLKTELTTHERKLSADSQQASVVPQLLREVEAMRRRYKDFDRRLPKQKELGEFLRDISSHLAAESLSNQVIEPGSPKRSELFHTLPIVLRFEGTYLEMARFLKRLDEMERLTRVERLHLVRQPESDQLEAELQINIYFTET
ncbi:MAG: type IV pilus inner membrane component PilO [Planctomycetota bacterium]|jgi:Tfp pilus assembly protein PilO